jgi:chromosomal replication initiation ATPase DnaA
MSIDKIMSAVSNATGVPVDDIMSRSRKSEKVQARHLFCKASSASGFTSVHIGRYLNRDHSTVLASVIVANDYISIYPVFKNQYNTIMQEIAN